MTDPGTGSAINLFCDNSPPGSYVVLENCSSKLGILNALLAATLAPATSTSSVAPTPEPTVCTFGPVSSAPTPTLSPSEAIVTVTTTAAAAVTIPLEPDRQQAFNDSDTDTSTYVIVIVVMGILLLGAGVVIWWQWQLIDRQRTSASSPEFEARRNPGVQPTLSERAFYNQTYAANPAHDAHRQPESENGDYERAQALNPDYQPTLSEGTLDNQTYAEI